MKLLTEKIKKMLPPLYATEGKEDAKFICKFFTPDNNWTWYALEFDGEDLFFGLVAGFELEYGYFSLKELQAIKGPLGLNVERDRWFEPQDKAKIYSKEKEAYRNARKARERTSKRRCNGN